MSANGAWQLEDWQSSPENSGNPRILSLAAQFNRLLSEDECGILFLNTFFITVTYALYAFDILSTLIST